ncbi:MAG TPA: hypothetical protein VLI05_03750 [Candidatus Saccharimonadia bacterium]|nr:hypothetical protein [Candidatus Saccharimonadia bacterium]
MQAIEPSENILPSRRTIWAGAIFGALALIDLSFTAWQLAYAYFSGQGLDADVPSFLIDAGLFLFAAYAASYQLRKIFRQLGHLHGLRRQVVIAEYDLPCSPGVAGALLDGDFDLAETKGMMIYLNQQGYLVRTPTADGEVWTVGRDDLSGLRPSEATLLVSLFAVADKLILPIMADRLSLASHATHDDILAEGRAMGLIKPAPKVPKFFLALHGVALNIGYAIIAFMFFLDIFFWHDVVTVNYPRYPVHLWQLLFIVALVLVVLSVAGGAYVRALVTARGLDLSTDIAGFYLFIKTVFAHPGAYLAKSDLEKYYPYAVAFRLPVTLPDGADEQWAILLGMA